MSTEAIMIEPAVCQSEEDENPDVNPESGGMVSVVFTSAELTVKALEKAREMTPPSSAGIAVIAVQTVPFVLPIDRTFCPMEYVIRHFEETIRVFPGKIKVFVYICRYRMDAYTRALKPQLPVYIGIRKRWWPTRNGRLVRKLRGAGFRVIAVESK